MLYDSHAARGPSVLNNRGLFSLILWKTEYNVQQRQDSVTLGGMHYLTDQTRQLAAFYVLGLH